MSGSPGAPLRYLWRAKLRGRARDLARRVRTPLGAFTAVLGLALVGGWIGSVVWRSELLERTGDVPSVQVVRLGLLAYLAFIALTSVEVRGLYLPKPEIERLFAAPVSRASIVRFRLGSTMLATLPFAVLMGVLLGPRFHSTAVVLVTFAVFVVQSTVFGQAVSLGVAPTTGRLDGVLKRLPAGTPRVVGALGVISIFLWVSIGPGVATEAEVDLQRAIDELYQRERTVAPPVPEVPLLDRIAGAAPVRILTAPLHPWASALVAPSLSAALPWILLAGAILALTFELVVRLPVDFRESALRSSENVERRLARMRRGQGGASALGTSRRTRGLSVPRAFGRGPFGALVWLRVTWLVRQARGALLMTALVAVGGFLFGTGVLDEPGGETAALAVLGVVYLTSGLRADFRTDLDRMESIRAWPVGPRTVFVASVLPGAVLASVVIAGVLVARSLALGHPLGDLGPILPALVPAAYAWVAVDNAVFLLFPVRFVPGQGSAVQNAGRSFLLVLLRATLLVAYLFVAGGGAALLTRAVGPSVGAETALWLGVLWAVVVGAAGLVLLTLLGAWALRRYDVSRTPPGR
ncbi:MAG: putative ABC exporter domain-containing protein [Planctomycetota bacterium]